MKKIIQLIALATFVLAGSAFAQIVPTEPNPAGTFSFDGKQTDAGHFVWELRQVMDNSFVMTGYSKQDIMVLMTVSFNFDGPADYDFGNKIVGGSWNVAIFSNKGAYAGSIFGDVIDGKANWIFAPKRLESAEGTRTTDVKLRVKGGTDEFENIREGSDAHFTAETALVSGETKGLLEDLIF